MPYTNGSLVIAQDAEQLPPMGHLAMVALRPRVGVLLLSWFSQILADL